jgi:hypothetical protein
MKKKNRPRGFDVQGKKFPSDGIEKPNFKLTQLRLLFIPYNL